MNYILTAQAARKRKATASTFGIFKKGFTLLEMVVVILLLGLIAAIVVPNLQNLNPAYQRKAFLSRLNGLVQIAWQQALSTRTVHRLFFDLDNRIIRIEEETTKDSQGKPQFKPVTIAYLNTSYQWSTALTLKQFYIDEKDMITRPGIKTEQVWFFISADGIAQPVILNITDANELDQTGNPKKMGLILNPFTAQFNVYDTFQKP